MKLTRILGLVVAGALARGVCGETCNVRVVTDASPDYTDLPSMVHSMTAKWATPEEKCWAVFYWNHIGRRQTSPMILHGMALTDPVRQFNDYGFTMCSTISGINQSIWEEMGLKHRYWDISNHTVAEVFYDGRWHMYDNSLSALYTLCDGKTLAGVEDIGKEGACALSGGKVEKGHIAKYHCLTATSINGFLTGADTARPLDEETVCFNPNGLKLRTYFYDWDHGHRYILNVREGESYTRYYHSLGTSSEFYVPNGGKDPEKANPRYRVRGNGVWTYTPPAGERMVRVESANVMTAVHVEGAGGQISTNNGLSWEKIGQPAQVNGAYEAVLKLDGDATKISTTTEVNSKTLPRLNLGKNTVYVGAGEQTESVVIWPELEGAKYRTDCVEEKNLKADAKHAGWHGVVYPAAAKEDAYMVYRIEAPRDLVKVTFGGRFYNRAPKSHIDLLYSTDGGKNWIKQWSLTDTKQPWDVIHYETVAIPAGVKSVLVKYLMNSPAAESMGCSIYAVRMEGDYLPAEKKLTPLEVTYTWKEVQEDRSLVERSHTQLVEKFPTKYTIDVGGMDHPVMESITISAAKGSKLGYSDGKDAGGEKFVGHKLTIGKNLAVGKKYTLSHPSLSNWGAGDPDGTKLTDGVCGPTYAGGGSYHYGVIWNNNTNPTVSLDLGSVQKCASFGMNFHGYPWWDALKGQVKDKVEVFTSVDGKEYVSQGFLKTDLRWKDLPVNYMWPDEETVQGYMFRVIPGAPVEARFVQYRITSKRMLCATELEVLDSINSEPFDLKIALPDEK